MSEEVVIPENYTGKYIMENGENTWTIGYDETLGMYVSIFWSYMPLRYCGQNAFTMISFPVKIQFDADLQSFSVSDNYEWKYDGKRFFKSEAE